VPAWPSGGIRVCEGPALQRHSPKFVEQLDFSHLSVWLCVSVSTSTTCKKSPQKVNLELLPEGRSLRKCGVKGAKSRIVMVNSGHFDQRFLGD